MRREASVRADYLRRLDVREILEHYGAENMREEVGGDGTTEIIMSCLIDRVDPHHANGDRNPSAAMNVEKKLYCCYSSGWSGDLLTLIAKMEGIQSTESVLSALGEYAENGTGLQLLHGSTVDAQTFVQELTRILDYVPTEPPELPFYSPSVLEPWLVHSPYWEKRGISSSAVSVLRLGYDHREERIVFPHFFNSRLVGWQKRTIHPGVLPKYRSSPNFPKSETLYNLDSARDYPRVCVVESPMSVARAVSLGVPNVVATFGAKVSEQQADLLSDFEMVYVWFDDDDAGYGGLGKLRTLLSRRTVLRIIQPDKSRDMADCTLDEIESKIAQSWAEWEFPRG